MTPQELSAAVADVVEDHMRLVMAPVLADVKSLQTQIAGWESRWNDLGTLRERVAVVEAKEQPQWPDPVEPVDLSPVLERLAVAESKLEALPVAEKALGEMRDRLVTVEIKAATELRTEPVARSDDSLTPMLERLASTEARLSVLGDLRDRMVAVETKASAPNPPDAAFYELRDRVSTMETTAAIPTAAEIMLSDVKSRLTALETRPAPEPVVLDQKAVDLTPVELRLTRVELGLEMKVAEITPVLSALADHTKDIGAIRERLAVVEVRPPVPGPPGEPGPSGTNGVDGKDGLAGLSFEGVYQEGQSYEKGHLVTWAGSCWHCNSATTTKPGDGSKDWVLCVKRGRDGRDGQSAPGALPVVAVGSRA